MLIVLLEKVKISNDQEMSFSERNYRFKPLKVAKTFNYVDCTEHLRSDKEKSETRQRSGNGTIRKKFQLRNP